MKFPKSILFILCAEFGERFCVLGLTTILFLYFVDGLNYSKNKATILYHTFSMLIFVFPLLGGILADSWLGKYKTILYLSIVYAFGNLLLYFSSIPTLNLPTREMSMLGLLVIALGTGCAIPCTTAFGGEQFELPRQKAQLTTYFSLHILGIHVALFLGAFILPILRKDVTCFNQNTCYSLAFLVTNIVMVICTVIFFGGRKFYKRRKPNGDATFNVAKCIIYAVYRKIKSNKKQDHWLDHAEGKYDKRMIKDVKTILNVLKILIPLPLFWALNDQMGSHWIYQATYMDGEVFGYLIKPDQFQFVNPLLIIILIPTFQIFIYPFMDKFLYINTPLRKITLAGFLASISFIVAGVLELNLESEYVVEPSSGLAQIRIFNTINCNASIHINHKKFFLDGLDMYQNLSIPVKGNTSLNFIAEYNNCQFTAASKFTISGNLEVHEAQASSWALTIKGLNLALPDRITKSKSGDPLVRALIYASVDLPTNSILKLESSSRNYQLSVTKELSFTKFIEVNPNKYNIRLERNVIAENQLIRYGGIYTIVGYVSNDTTIIRTITTVQPNSIHIFWQFPQYLLISVGSVIIQVTAVEFVFTQSPAIMKSFMLACWMLTMAIGNLIVVVITEAQLFERQVMEIFLYSILMAIDMLIFILIAKSYKYVEISSDGTVNEILNTQTNEDQIVNNENSSNFGEN